jgi:hypothetical protein
MTTSRIKANRIDGKGFMLGRLLNVERQHGHRVYTVKTLSGHVLRLSGRDYAVTGHSPC